ncbi:hypothetical protein BHU72_08135 [Desulfuribacillus stibiiarsenatis]|uniref:ATP-grasp domain-containing protein n=1 Tax=Desulfuribacillus stibiiarsenatis TaxID=1390249 RepID=A0A1E5L431_9FIRM|nr:YheC/YheD family protein [Desulfuribacillus stibiiarsenatis]OEH84793.1 hypothetical protein BHU72_08135 [Desulfuribacillus stibiiarsenatis]
MLCTIQIKQNELSIKFHAVTEIIHHKMLRIQWGNEKLGVLSSKKYKENIVSKIRLLKTSPLSIPTTIIKYQKIGDTIFLAPVISILLDPCCVKGKTVKSKKGKMEVLNQLAYNLLTQGFLISAVQPDDILVKEDQYIAGHILTKDPRRMKTNWQKAVFPFPKVVYNQISARNWEAFKVSQNAKEILNCRLGKRFFNSCFLNKFTSYDILQNNPNATPFLLDTRKYSLKTLKEMLNLYDSLYIKPVRNSLGVGILRLKKMNDRKFSLQAKKDNGFVSYTLKSKSDIMKFFQVHRHKGYLIQQGIELLQYNNRIFDIRALAQKNSKGNWQLTGAGARVAAPNAFMTHVPNGGEIFNLTHIFTQTIGKQEVITKLQKQLDEIAVVIPETLERELGLHFGEISMDIGISREYRMYLIEINAKPMRFDEPEIQKKSVENLTHYISYLSSWDEMPDM